MSRTVTDRVMRLACPVCMQPLIVHVRGLGAAMTEDEWLAQLDDIDRQYLHNTHDANTPIVAAPRARTRRLT